MSEAEQKIDHIQHVDGAVTVDVGRALAFVGDAVPVDVEAPATCDIRAVNDPML